MTYSAKKSDVGKVFRTRYSCPRWCCVATSQKLLIFCCSHKIGTRLICLNLWSVCMEQYHNDNEDCCETEYAVHYSFLLSLSISFFSSSISFTSLFNLLLIANMRQAPMKIRSPSTSKKQNTKIVAIMPVAKPIIFRSICRIFSAIIIMDLFPVYSHVWCADLSKSIIT